MTSQERSLYVLMSLIVIFFAAAGLLHDGAAKTIEGLWALQLHSARLINDFTVIGGIGAALVNAALVGALSLILVAVNKVRLSGPTIAAVFTLMGFSLFGKTPLNIAPIILGVFIASRLVKKPFRNYIIIALFGTALGPLATFLVREAGFTGIAALAAGAAGGVAAGMLLPALAMAMLRLHEGYNLYNLGLTCGFFGLFAASLLVAFGNDVAIKVIWNDAPSPLLTAIVPAVSLLLILWGLFLDGAAAALKGQAEIYRLSGRLPSDFMDSVSPGASLVNAGLLGAAGSLYIFIIGGDFNGPTIGGLFTVVGFATFGKHPRNTWPVALGVLAATLLSGKSLTAPGPLLALLFGTTLAPLAGEFGPAAGFAAGFLHLVLVERTAAWHGGLDLYNNGFAGGLVAAFMVAVIEWYRSNIHERTRTS